MTWSIRIPVRSYELDALGHLNHAVYHQYAEVARVEGFAAAGCAWDGLIAAGTAPVLLTSTIHFRRELRAGDSVDVDLRIEFGPGKTFNADSTITLAEGAGGAEGAESTVSAEITCLLGVMDLGARRLLADPQAVLAEHGLDVDKL
ncbi:acyl-CoA thioesterase [Actinokineospora diospyrosa]|uniref:Acyl-CoA thioester hydrolase n=1 Tax=Actinokineospora diospyrosa TaxID=103728 RepID=A0ABT1I9X2_9PSEU|nr:thioesterase family protein [Actinokineospora diospyrosa]MCP2269435.1 acyl-CoA thioester hydrolase [Actinokineospora diospyrosa]